MCVAIISLLLFTLSIKCADCKSQMYDFIVVGGGHAGCIVAARLSEIAHFKVILIEAGTKPPLISNVPMLAELLLNSAYDWNYTSTPQRYAGDRIFHMIRGKMLGGCGSFNSLNWFRGNKRDYALWEKEGADGWNWNSLIPYFRKTESDFSLDSNSVNSGFKGPISLTSSNSNISFFTTFINEMQRRGYSYKDPADGDQVGYSFARLSIFKNERQSTYTNYLKRSIERKNLKVVKNALVTKILFNEQKEAIGVVYKKKSKQYKVMAKREVIISGGAINSPQLLMLSGIGPKKHLESLNIEVLSDLPVGSNFHDHVMLISTFAKNAENVYTPETLKQFFAGKGPLINFTAVSNFANTALSRDKEYPDVQITTVGQFLTPNSKINYFIWFYVQRPKSTGSIRLKNTNAESQPLIDPNYLSDENDVKILVELAKDLVSLSRIANRSQNEFSLSMFNDSQCLNFSKEHDDYWRCIVRTSSTTSCHFCCSCRMGSPQRPTTVVDSELKVLGVKKLRVIDASVMPYVPSSNIQAVVAMIAEKGSDLIKKTHLQ